MIKHYKLGHRQAMTSAGMILRWIDQDNAISPAWREFIRKTFENKTVEQFITPDIEVCRKTVMGIVEEATTDYYESVIALKSLTQTMRICRALYDVLNGLELMELE
ncbi:MAG: hypothetical protein RR382_00695 [Tannerellaceae bacterium]